jgi:hypothetical protein
MASLSPMPSLSVGESDGNRPGGRGAGHFVTIYRKIYEYGIVASGS